MCPILRENSLYDTPSVIRLIRPNIRVGLSIVQAVPKMAEVTKGEVGVAHARCKKRS